MLGVARAVIIAEKPEAPQPSNLPILLPVANSWSAPATIISPGTGAALDNNFDAPGAVGAIRRPSDGARVLYYIAADGTRSSDGGPRHRRLFAATSTDGNTWTKHGGATPMPIITYFPAASSNTEEEGIFGAAPFVHDGQVYMLWCGMYGVGSSQVGMRVCRSINASGDGLTFSNNSAATAIVVFDAGATVFWPHDDFNDESWPQALWKKGAPWRCIYGSKNRLSGDPWDQGFMRSADNDFTSWGNSEQFRLNTQSLFGTGGRLRQCSVIDRKIAGLLNVFTSNLTNANNDARIAICAIDADDPTPPSPQIEHFDLGSVNHYGMPVMLDGDTWRMFSVADGDNPIQQRTQAVVTGAAPAWPSMADFIQGNASRHYVTESAIAHGPPYGFLLRTRVDENAGTDRQYTFRIAEGAVEMHLQEASNTEHPDGWRVQMQGSTGRLFSASRPGADGVERVVLAQGDSSKRELWFATATGAVLEAAIASGVPATASAVWYVGAHSPTSTARFWGQKLADLAVFRRLLLPAEMAAIAAGYSPLEVLGADALHDYWRLNSALAAVPNEIPGRPALIRQGSGWA